MGCSDFITDKSAGIESTRIIDNIKNRNFFEEEPNVTFPQFLREMHEGQIQVTENLLKAYPNLMGADLVSYFKLYSTRHKFIN